MSDPTEQSDASPNVQLERPTLRNMAQLAACAIHDLAHAGGGFGSVRDALVDFIEFAFLEHIKKCHAQGDEQHADYPSGNEAWLELPYSIREDLEMKSWISGYDHAGVRAAIARQEAEAPGDKPLRVNCPPSDLLRSLTPEELAALPPMNEAEIREALEQGGRELEAVRTGRPVRPSTDTRSDRPAPCACGSIAAFHYPGCILYREGSSPEGLPPDGSVPLLAVVEPPAQPAAAEPDDVERWAKTLAGDLVAAGEVEYSPESFPKAAEPAVPVAGGLSPEQQATQDAEVWLCDRSEAGEVLSPRYCFVHGHMVASASARVKHAELSGLFVDALLKAQGFGLEIEASHAELEKTGDALLARAEASGRALRLADQSRDAALAQVEALKGAVKHEQDERSLQLRLHDGDNRALTAANTRIEELVAALERAHAENAALRATPEAIQLRCERNAGEVRLANALLANGVAWDAKSQAEKRVVELEAEREHLLFGCAETFVRFEAQERARLPLAIHQREWLAAERTRMAGGSPTVTVCTCSQREKCIRDNCERCCYCQAPMPEHKSDHAWCVLSRGCDTGEAWIMSSMPHTEEDAKRLAQSWNDTGCGREYRAELTKTAKARS